MAQYPSGQRQGKRCAFDADLASSRESVVAQGFAVILSNAPCDVVSGLSLIEHHASQPADLSIWRSSACALGELVEDFLDFLPFEVLEQSACERGRGIYA